MSTTVPTSLRAVGAAVALTAVAVLASLFGGVVVALSLFLLKFEVTSPPVFLGLTAVGQVVFLGVAHVYRRWRGGRPAVALAGLDARDAAVALGGTVLAIVVAVASSSVLQAFGLLPTSLIGEAGVANPVVFLGLAVLSVVLIAPAEEYLFRGTIQGRLRETFGPTGAVAGSSLLFGSVHLANYAGSLSAVVAGALLIAVTGVVLGASYEYTGNLAVPIALHALYNVVLLLTAYVTV